METPIIKQKRGLSPIWFLPLMALGIGGWLLYQSITEDGIDIIIEFENAIGIASGKTQVIYKGIPVGQVKNVTVNSKMDTVNVHIEIVKEAEAGLVKDTKFWIVKPEVSATRITGLDTLVSGSYIEVARGKSTTKSTYFIGIDDPSQIPPAMPGKVIILETEDGGSLSIGSQILFNKIQVGEVFSVKLNPENHKINLSIIIYKKYCDLVTNRTRFWNISGVEVTASLARIQVKMGSVKSLLVGGITFDSPEGGSPVANNTDFELYDNKADARLANSPRITLRFPETDSVAIDTPIRYKGKTIGVITDILVENMKNSRVAQAAIQPNAKKLFLQDTQIWLVTPKVKISGIENLSTLVKGPHLSLQPGTGEPATEFEVHKNRPIQKKLDTGLSLVLETDRLGSLNINGPIYYRQIRVGHILGYELAETSQAVLIYINIHDPYTGLIKENTKFWNASGLRITGGLMTTMKFATESVESLLAGGIALATPEKAKEMGKDALPESHFLLHVDSDKTWLAWRPEIQLAPGKKTAPVQLNTEKTQKRIMPIP